MSRLFLAAFAILSAACGTTTDNRTAPPLLAVPAHDPLALGREHGPEPASAVALPADLVEPEDGPLPPLDEAADPHEDALALASAEGDAPPADGGTAEEVTTAPEPEVRPEPSIDCAKRPSRRCCRAKTAACMRCVDEAMAELARWKVVCTP